MLTNLKSQHNIFTSRHQPISKDLSNRITIAGNDCYRYSAPTYGGTVCFDYMPDGSCRFYHQVCPHFMRELRSTPLAPYPLSNRIKPTINSDHSDRPDRGSFPDLGFSYGSRNPKIRVRKNYYFFGNLEICAFRMVRKLFRGV